MAIMLNWSVRVERRGEHVLTIEPGCLSGRELSGDDEEAIRTAARHLLAFIGDPPPPEPDKFTKEERRSWSFGD